jgi:hypothetical protein
VQQKTMIFKKNWQEFTHPVDVATMEPFLAEKGPTDPTVVYRVAVVVGEPAAPSGVESG